ncbi:MAG: sigma-70 family RNA polymerase sigma factor [Vicinamibacteria bacterium]|nr:sigma-70 family RNA polymerase sigma factor [Vicinamibacteria bacterium]
MTDNELLERCRSGDQAAWSALVARHARKVFSVAWRFTGRSDEAEDLTQEIFVKVYQQLSRFDPQSGQFPAWLMRVARNHAIDNYRKRREERVRRADDPAILDAMADAAAGPLEDVVRKERAEIVRAGLAALPAELREPLILCDLRGLPYEEIAHTLGLPLGTVKSRINRGRTELARRLMRRRKDLGFA